MAITVTYSEVGGSPTENVTRQGAKTAVRTLICDWTDRWTLMAEILNEDYENESGTLMTCASSSSAPLRAANTGATTIATYEKALVTANYQIVVAVVGGVGPTGEEIIESLEPWSEFLTVGKANLKWFDAAGEDLADDQKPGKLMNGLTYIFRKTFQTDLPAAVRGLIGHVNNVTVTSTSDGMNNIQFEAETLLYNPPMITRTVDEFGLLTWDVEYRLMYRPNWDTSVTPKVARGWNYYWNQDKVGGAGFDKIWDVKAAGQYKQYPLGIFSAI